MWDKVWGQGGARPARHPPQACAGGLGELLCAWFREIGGVLHNSSLAQLRYNYSRYISPGCSSAAPPPGPLPPTAHGSELKSGSEMRVWHHHPQFRLQGKPPKP